MYFFLGIFYGAFFGEFFLGETAAMLDNLMINFLDFWMVY
jgi:hypothetical protein